LPTMGGEVRYCTTEDGVRIAYKVEGEGPPLLLCQMFTESFAHGLDMPAAVLFNDKLGEGRQLIHYDMRGTGLSDRDPQDLSGDALVRDIEAVARASGLRRFSILAYGISGPRAITYAARHPRLVSNLILCGTCATPTDAYAEEAVSAFIQLIRSNWAMASQMFADVSLRDRFPEEAAIAREINRRSVTAHVLARLFEQAYPTSDASALLPLVRARTLVLHRVDDPGFAFAGGQRIAAGIPGAKFVPLQGSISYAFLEDPQSILDSIARFLQEEGSLSRQRAGQAVADTLLRTVLFTDVVAHTEMMQRLGDAKGREVLREHERIMRVVLKAHGGTEVKTMGDGFMASFGSVTRAVECARALQRAFAERNEAGDEPLTVRVGLNAGEPIQEEGDLFGSTVILAARIAAQAEGGEVLASLAVRELCAGKGFLFADRGEHVLRGFEDPVRMYEISWRE